MRIVTSCRLPGPAPEQNPHNPVVLLRGKASGRVVLLDTRTGKNFILAKHDGDLTDGNCYPGWGADNHPLGVNGDSHEWERLPPGSVVEMVVE